MERRSGLEGEAVPQVPNRLAAGSSNVSPVSGGSEERPRTAGGSGLPAVDGEMGSGLPQPVAVVDPSMVLDPHAAITALTRRSRPASWSLTNHTDHTDSVHQRTPVSSTRRVRTSVRRVGHTTTSPLLSRLTDVRTQCGLGGCRLEKDLIVERGRRARNRMRSRRDLIDRVVTVRPRVTSGWVCAPHWMTSLESRWSVCHQLNVLTPASRSVASAPESENGLARSGRLG
jgi:hypothetical protein